MPKKQQKAVKVSQRQIEVIVKRWQPRLGLENWKIEVQVTPDGDMDNDDALFEIERHKEADRAIIHISESVTRGDYEATETIDEFFIETAVVHEMCHCVVRDLTFVVRDDLEELHGQVVHELIMRNLHRHEEKLVENLATALVRSWPE